MLLDRYAEDMSTKAELMGFPVNHVNRVLSSIFVDYVQLRESSRNPCSLAINIFRSVKKLVRSSGNICGHYGQHHIIMWILNSFVGHVSYSLGIRLSRHPRRDFLEAVRDIHIAQMMVYSAGVLKIRVAVGERIL